MKKKKFDLANLFRKSAWKRILLAENLVNFAFMLVLLAVGVHDKLFKDDCFGVGYFMTYVSAVAIIIGVFIVVCSTSDCHHGKMDKDDINGTEK